MGIDDGRQRARVPGEPLRQEEVPRRPINVGDGRMPQRMERVEPVEPGDDLPGAEEGRVPTTWRLVLAGLCCLALSGEQARGRARVPLRPVKFPWGGPPSEAIAGKS